MSVEMMGRVWRSTLPTDEKFVALAVADHADPDGRNIYPSQLTIAEMVGKSDRAVRDTLRKLEARGVLELDPWPDDGRYRPTNRYRMVTEALPAPPETSSGTPGSPLPVPPEESSAPPPEESSGAPPAGSSAPPETSSGTPGSPLPVPPEAHFLRSVRDPEEEEDPDLITSSSSDPDPDAREPLCPEHHVEGIPSDRTRGTFWHVKPGGGSHTFVPEPAHAERPEIGHPVRTWEEAEAQRQRIRAATAEARDRALGGR